MPETENNAAKERKQLTCGLIMPMSQLEGYPESQWEDVRSILSNAVTDAGFEPQIVSDADDVGIIQNRIIQNLYENPIVVCDVSGKNPNVMFELGIRLAFDKPTIIVKDDKTTYSFDTAPIEHLQYPRDLRFAEIVTFKTELTEKIKATYKRATEDKTYTTFLKHFGTFTTPKLATQEVPWSQFVLDELRQLRETVSGLGVPKRALPVIGNRKTLCTHNCTPETAQQVSSLVSQILGIPAHAPQMIGKMHFHYSVPTVLPEEVRNDILKAATSVAPLARWL